MDSFILFQQLVVLCAMMATGYIAFKTNIIDKHSYQKISSLVVWILNPFLVITGVVGKENTASAELVLQNIIMVGILYGGMFLIGIIYVRVFRMKEGKDFLYKLVMLFPNVGFMGIPLVKAMFGSEYIIYVAFYMLAFNILAYSYGVYLASGISGRKAEFSWKNLVSPGNITSIIAIIIFAFHIPVAGPVVTYVNYVGNAAIPFSMFVIGASLAQMDMKSAFLKGEYYVFLAVKMVIIPLVLIYLSKLLPFDDNVLGVFMIMICMPVASMTTMLSEEYSGDGSECTKLISITTILTVITAPVVVYIAGLI